MVGGYDTLFFIKHKAIIYQLFGNSIVAAGLL
jgi:hypothetical protein